MSGRRSHTRFSVVPASEGHLRIPRDVVLQTTRIQRPGANGSPAGALVAISREAGIVGEEVTVGIVGTEQPPSAMRVIESRPVVVDGAMRHRLSLESLESGEAIRLLWPGDESHSAGVSNGVTGVVTRNVPVRVPNCSSSGCLLETHSSLEVGTIGLLELWMGDGPLCDEVRLVRCLPIHGAGALYHVGAEFLWTSAPTRSSLRRAMGDGLTVVSSLRG